MKYYRLDKKTEEVELVTNIITELNQLFDSPTESLSLLQDDQIIENDFSVYGTREAILDFAEQSDISIEIDISIEMPE